MKATSHSSPLVVTFANAAFLPMLEVWTACLARLGVRRLRIYGLDDATLAWCSSRGIEARSMPWSGTRQDLWQARIRVFRQLLDDGEDFIHSDADAIWIRNPFEEGSAPALADDLVFSTTRLRSTESSSMPGPVGAASTRTTPSRTAIA